ncbi:MAG: peptide-methionine (S)-S-oxide reductase [Allomuricauda sp.]
MDKLTNLHNIAFGGSCHWCTEAIFQSLLGVKKVEQGWISSTGENQSFSEGVIVYFDSDIIHVDILIEVHLYTHSCTSNHSFRTRYRSAVYTFSEHQSEKVVQIIARIQNDFDKPIITEVIPFVSFRKNSEIYQNYYFDNPNKQFCKTFIEPKLKLLMDEFSVHTNQEKLQHLKK